MSTFRSILIADDEPSIRHVLTLVLAEKGYEVRAVQDGEEALKELSVRPYDAVICDVRMPKVDGLELLQKALPQWPDLTFIVMSAYGTPEAALKAESLGAYDYVPKPFKPEEMVPALRKAEERQRLVRENRRLKRTREAGPDRWQPTPPDADPTVTAFDQRWADLRTKRAELAVRFRPTAPEFVSLDRDLAALAREFPFVE